MTDASASTDDVLVECDLPHPPEMVWRAITDQDLLGRWLMPTDLQPEVGARFRLLPPEHEQRPLVDCEVIESIPNRTLRWRQTEKEFAEDHSVESVVTFELSPTQDGTHLRIVHDQFKRIVIAANAGATNVISFERGARGARISGSLMALRRAA